MTEVVTEWQRQQLERFGWLPPNNGSCYTEWQEAQFKETGVMPTPEQDMIHELLLLVNSLSERVQKLESRGG